MVRGLHINAASSHLREFDLILKIWRLQRLCLSQSSLCLHRGLFLTFIALRLRFQLCMALITDG